jgi:hypothetical protein
VSFEFTDVAKATESKPRWVLQNVIPVGLTVIGGPPKHALKSTLTYALALAASGHHTPALPRWMNKAAKTGPVLMFSQEATAGEIKHAMRVGMSSMPKTNHIYIADDPFAWRLDTDEAVAAMHDALAGKFAEEHDAEPRPPIMAVLDPLRDFHSVEEKDSGEMIAILGPLRAWAVENDAAVVLVHHTVKPVEGRSLLDPDSLRGSSAIFGKADGVIMIQPGDPGWLRYNAVFKRGPGWKAQLRLGVWGGVAGELIPGKARGVIRLLNVGEHELEAVRQCSMSEPEWVTMKEILLRNELLVISRGALLTTKAGRQWAKESRGE